MFANVGEAITREKQIKSWTRAKRVELIEAKNPAWQDLAAPWFPDFPTASKAKADPSARQEHRASG
jgi:hypothetical protein